MVPIGQSINLSQEIIRHLPYKHFNCAGTKHARCIALSAMLSCDRGDHRIICLRQHEGVRDADRGAEAAGARDRRRTRHDATARSADRATGPGQDPEADGAGAGTGKGYLNPDY